MKDVSKEGVAKLGHKFLARICEKNQSDEDNFLILKKQIHSCRSLVFTAIYVFSLQGVIYFTSVHMVFGPCLYLIWEKSLIKSDSDRIQKLLVISLCSASLDRS